MEKILAQLYPIRQEAPTFAKTKIDSAQGFCASQIYGQTVKKRPFQSIFSGFAIFQNFGRKFPIAREKHSTAPFTHQNPPFSPNNPANSQHFNPS